MLNLQVLYNRGNSIHELTLFIDFGKFFSKLLSNVYEIRVDKISFLTIIGNFVAVCVSEETNAFTLRFTSGLIYSFPE